MSTKFALVPNKVPVATVNTVPGTCKYRGASTWVKYKVHVHSFPGRGTQTHLSVVLLGMGVPSGWFVQRIGISTAHPTHASLLRLCMSVLSSMPQSWWGSSSSCLIFE